ncbi:uncharacterized protein LAESUDRAFT_739864 [Laetiporus sulphureus 93-53]|uniref:Uncharacterized protein n=1 Tax=Laetiporus sulphureus 93-53 TaxID=1314785 RepID=A0A165ANX6_9APHY|nr:uncharacterized protein LAESUDRAFT_739864 [Laetiporus sulphureus 93-53]KZS99376.1 hypothetical protein LAESUDRAFT_739864 [Laetiporus sulphureus 93-53]
MSRQRRALWEAELDDDWQDIDLSSAIGNYGQMYDDEFTVTWNAAQSRIDEGTLLVVQQQMVQQAEFAQVPNVVKRFIVHFYQAMLDNNLAEITKFYSKTKRPEAEVIAPLVNDDQIFLIPYRELYYRHLDSRLQCDIDDCFHSYSYGNSCELFN